MASNTTTVRATSRLFVDSKGPVHATFRFSVGSEGSVHAPASADSQPASNGTTALESGNTNSGDVVANEGQLLKKIHRDEEKSVTVYQRHDQNIVYKYDDDDEFSGKRTRDAEKPWCGNCMKLKRPCRNIHKIEWIFHIKKEMNLLYTYTVLAASFSFLVPNVVKGGKEGISLV